MPSKKAASPPQRAKLTASQKQVAIQRIRQRVDELKAFDVRAILRASDGPVKQLESAVENTIASVFGPESYEYQNLKGKQAFHFDTTAYTMSVMGRGGTTAMEIQQGVRRGIERTIALLTAAVDSLEEELKFEHVPAFAAAAEPTDLSRDVFVVHGHDDAAREEAASFLRKAGFNPVILHEQASGGRTVIEKLEHYSNVDFAVVLLTPDDVGGPEGGAMQPRARQNVIAELFYFMGKLGRQKVCALMKGAVEIPSDVLGVVYVPMDAPGGWKTSLLRELEDAGHEVDWRALR